MTTEELADHLRRLAQKPADADAVRQHYLANKRVLLSDSWSFERRLQQIPEQLTEEQLQRTVAHCIERKVTKVIEDKRTKLLLVYEVEEVLVQIKNKNHNDGFTIHI